MGAPAVAASLPPPLEKRRISPALDLVPSGNTKIEIPSLIRATPWVNNDLPASRGWLRSIAMGFCRRRAQPQKGIRNNSRFKIGETGNFIV
ncbi:uncharacterized protein METZ01_LOCUS29773 [marine metagenome]|uniref:Uncharacterized protein n=1 Tax=marine metagenome TaxID=408172 RepID=A0A381QEV0_9ZZZZ